MGILNFLNTIFQSTLMSYIPYYFINKNSESNKKIVYLKFILCNFSIFISIYSINLYIGNSVMCVFAMHLANIAIISIFYNKNKVNALCGYSMLHLILQLSALLFSLIYSGYLVNLEFVKNSNIFTLYFIYAPQYILSYIIFKFRYKLYNLFLKIIKRNHYFEIILLVSFACDYISSINWLIYGNDNGMFKNFFIFLIFSFIIATTIYLVQLKNKIYEIQILNSSINLKNNELRAIKHDYGSQISYLYGLCLMDKYERLEALLKEIIEKNNNIPGNIEFLSNSDTILSDIINPLIPSGINVIIDETYDICNIGVSEFDLHKIISNIVNNAVTAMNSKGIITIKVYRIFNYVYLKIQNTGPKIDSKIIDKIFNAGFTTKNSSDNGFGLAIIKDIVSKNNGSIEVKSNDEFTEFKIKFDLN